MYVWTWADFGIWGREGCCNTGISSSVLIAGENGKEAYLKKKAENNANNNNEDDDDDDNYNKSVTTLF